MTKQAYTITFFGSFEPHSATVLHELLSANFLQVKQVVTTPPLITKKGELKNSVQKLAEQKHISVLTSLPEKVDSDFIITAGYGNLLPGKLLRQPKIGALNLHFSLLPKYRGANPGEWAILLGETKTGVTVIEMNEEYDAGGILAQKEIAISENETRESLYEKLYKVGGQFLPQVIADFADKKIAPLKQASDKSTYASRFKRDDAYISWEVLESLMAGEKPVEPQLSTKLKKALQSLDQAHPNPQFVERATRALYGFPNLWTKIPTSKGEKRMKIFSCQVENGHTKDNTSLSLLEVQIEGQQKALWNQVKNIIKK